MAFLIPLQILIPIALVIIILIVILWIFYIRNKKLFAKLSEEKQKLNSYKKSIKNLQNQSDSKKILKELNTISRKFLKEYFNLPTSLTYLELSTIFKKKNKPEIAEFCSQMSDTQYKGREITLEQVKALINSFYKIVEGY